MSSPSLLYDRRFFAAALILAHAASHAPFRAVFGDNAAAARRRLAQEALDLADALIALDEDSRVGLLGVPCPTQPLDPPF